MEYHLTKGIQRSNAAHLSLALPSGHPSSLVTEIHKGITKGSMHRESPLVSSNLTVPEATPFPLKSSGSFYSQPSWTGSRAWPFEKPVASSAASLSGTPNVSRSHLPMAPSSAQPTSYSSSATSGASELIMMGSSGISSLDSKESNLPDPGGELGENREKRKEGKKQKGKKTKLGKMYKQASRSTKAISRLFFHSPPSAGIPKRSSLTAPLPLVVPPEEDQVIDPFASGKFVASYGLSPVEASAPASYQRTKSFTEVNSAESQFLGSPSVSSTPGISDSPSLKAGQVIEGQSVRDHDIPFPLNVDASSSESLSPPSRRIRSSSMSTTRGAKPLYNDNPPPMPHMPSGDLLAQLLPSPSPGSLPDSVTRPRANSLLETRSRIVVQRIKAVPTKNDAGWGSMNGGMQPLTVIPMRADGALAVQAQVQLSDIDSTVEIQHERVALLPSMPPLSGKCLESSPDASVGQRWPAGNIVKDMGLAQELPTYPEVESLSESFPAVANVSRRRGSGSTSSGQPSPASHQSVTKPILPPLSTHNLSSSADSSDSETLVNGSPRSQRRLLPRSPSLPDLRPSFPEAPPVPKLKLIPVPEVQRLSERMHVRSPSMPTFSDASIPQPLPVSIVDGLKSRGRDTCRPTSRFPSMDSVPSREPPSITTGVAITSGPNPLTYASNFSQSARRDARSRTLSHVSIRPLAIHEKKPSASESISTISCFDHTHITVHPAEPSITSSASKVQTATCLLPQARRSIKSPSVPDLRARGATSSVISGHSRSQSSSTAIPGQIGHVQSPSSHSPPIPVPPIPPIPDNYKLRAFTNVKPETAPPINANFFRPSPKIPRPKEMSYPPTKKADKLFHARFNKELANEYDDAGFTDTSPTPSRTLSAVVSSSPGRRMLHKPRPLSMKGQARGDIPPVPPLPSSPPISALPASRIRGVPSRDRMIIGAAL